MTADPWGLEDDAIAEDLAALIPAEAGAADPAAPALSPAIRCRHCLELHAQCPEGAAELVRSRIRAEARDRLERCESVLLALNEAERVAVAGWVQGLLDRPPFSNGHGGDVIDRISALLDALWRDIYWTTPAEDERGGVPGGNEQLLAQRPGRYVAP